jgi:hypothetical protein
VPNRFSLQGVEEKNQVQIQKQELFNISKKVSLIIIKASIHIFFISIFETAFFFAYVSVYENSGIISTINTYYEPIKNSCQNWSYETKELLYEILQREINITEIDQSAQIGETQRTLYNKSLLNESQIISAVFMGLMIIVASYLCVKRVHVPWLGIIIENIILVVLLGLYEYLFFRAIIYKYNTISTPELNAYIMDGLWSCAKN